MINNNLDKQLMREMFMTIREAEIKNINTQKNDDKKMVKNITNYICKQVEKETTKNENKKY